MESSERSGRPSTKPKWWGHCPNSEFGRAESSDYHPRTCGQDGNKQWLARFHFDWGFDHACRVPAKFVPRSNDFLKTVSCGNIIFPCFWRLHILPTRLLVTFYCYQSWRKRPKIPNLNHERTFAERNVPTVLHSQWVISAMKGTLGEMCAVCNLSE